AYRSTDATTGGQVSLLQDFLSPQYLSSEPTGYFGYFTKQAVAKFQTDNKIPTSPQNLGKVGPLTRKTIHDLTCGGNASTSVTPLAPVQANPAGSQTQSGTS